MAALPKFIQSPELKKKIYLFFSSFNLKRVQEKEKKKRMYGTFPQRFDASVLEHVTRAEF